MEGLATDERLGVGLVNLQTSGKKTMKLVGHNEG
jgi:hypothetical protein